MATKLGRVATLLRDFDPAELAVKMAVERQTIWRWQQGHRLPRRRMLPLIALATAIPIERLREALRVDLARRGRQA